MDSPEYVNVEEVKQIFNKIGLCDWTDKDGSDCFGGRNIHDPKYREYSRNEHSHLSFTKRSGS